MPAGVCWLTVSNARQVALAGRKRLSWPKSQSFGGKFLAGGAEGSCVAAVWIPSVLVLWIEKISGTFFAPGGRGCGGAALWSGTGAGLGDLGDEDCRLSV